jgi:hypothetical protein
VKITTSFLTLDQLNKLNTKRLLAYRNKLLLYPYPDLDQDDKTGQIYKSDPDWVKTYNMVIDILNSREHIEK